MANDLNVVALVGRLVRDAETRYANSGTAMVRFSIAVNRNARDENGSWTDRPSYFDCIYAGKAAESVSQYLDKGRQVSIVGELRQNRWQDQDGQTRSRVEIFVNSLQLLSGPRDNQGSAPSQRENNSNMGQNSYSSSSYSRPQRREEVMPASMPELRDGPEDFQDDDIPF